ncbi:MAG: hypothetical protein EHM40_03400 [Chloroflexi bacterium]|nr:MAG: hypothetical protein EHM40_03400 [Chloroflexota bacterium]
METYKNLGGDSNISAYEIGIESIKVQFRDGSVYLYNCQSAGQGNIEQMKRLAVAGEGLNSFIMRNVRKAYAAKLR